MPRQIIRTGLGEQEYVTATTPAGATERQITIGTYQAPSAWHTADVATDTTLQLLIGAGHLDPPAGRYWVWTRYRDAAGELLTQRSVNSVVVDTDGGVPLDPVTPPVTAALVAAGDAATLAAANAYTDSHGGTGGLPAVIDLGGPNNTTGA